MSIIRAIFTLTATLGTAACVGAQQRPSTPAPSREPVASRVRVQERKGEDCVTVDGRRECRRIVTTFRGDSAFQRRAALGVQLGATASMRDTLGVFVMHVTPRGPAEAAGIVEGDRIMSINGIDLRVSRADAGDPYASGLPTRRLTREVGRLAPGTRVTLRVWSGGRIRDVQVTAGRAADLMEGPRVFGFGPDGPGGMMFRTAPLRTMIAPRIEIDEFRRPLRELEGRRLDLEDRRWDVERRRIDLRDREGRRIELRGPDARSAPRRIRIRTPREEKVIERGGEVEINVDRDGRITVRDAAPSRKARTPAPSRRR